MDMGNYDVTNLNDTSYNTSNYGRKVEEPILGVGTPIFEATHMEESRAKDKRKEILEAIGKENPDSIVSDELELQVIKSLLLNEEKVKMPELKDVGEEGFNWYPNIPATKIVNYHSDDDYTGIMMTCDRHEDGIKKVTGSHLYDGDNDGYADSFSMFAYDDNSPKKTMYIDLKRYDYFTETQE